MGTGSLYNILLKTSDGGETWDSATPDITNYFLHNLFFTNPDTGYLVGEHGMILKTTSGGVITGESKTLSGQKIKVFPNPNNGTFYIDLPETSSTSTTEIYDLSGVKIFNSILPGNNKKNEIQLPGIKPGLYIIKVISQFRVFTSKLIID